jgi:hypothetical protein
MKTLKKLCVAITVFATTVLFAGCTTEPSPNYELISCQPVEDPVKQVEWLQKIVQGNLQTNFPSLKIYSANLGNSLVYITMNGENHPNAEYSQQIYACDGTPVCVITYYVIAPNSNDPERCANMAKKVTNKKLIYQH